MSTSKKALKKPAPKAPAKALKASPKAPAMAAKKAPPKPAAKKVVKTANVKPAAKAPAKAAAAVAKAPVKASAKPAPTAAGKAPTASKVAAPAAKIPAKATASKAPVKAAPLKTAASKAAPTAATAAGTKASATPKSAASAKAPDKAAIKVDEAPVEQAKPAKVSKKARAEEVPAEPEEEIVLLDAEGRRYCRVRECDQASSVDGYCRYHYLLYWKNIQVRKKILSEGKLERYIEELTARYPDKYLEMLKKDLRTEKDFLAAIQELEIDESSVDNEYEDEAQNYLDEVRGMGSEAGSSDRDEEF